MASLETGGAKSRVRPYRSVREDPQYPKLKQVINHLPPDKKEYLKSYLKRCEQGE